MLKFGLVAPISHELLVALDSQICDSLATATLRTPEWLPHSCAWIHKQCPRLLQILITFQVTVHSMGDPPSYMAE